MIYQHKIRKVPVYAKLDVFPTAEEAQREQQIVMERNSKKLSPSLIAIQEKIKKTQEAIILNIERKRKHTKISKIAIKKMIAWK